MKKIGSRNIAYAAESNIPHRAVSYFAAAAFSGMLLLSSAMNASAGPDRQPIHDSETLTSIYEYGALSVNKTTFELSFRYKGKGYSHKIRNRPPFVETGEMIGLVSMPEKTWIVCRRSLVMAIGRNDIMAGRTEMQDEQGDMGVDATELPFSKVLGSRLAAWNISEIRGHTYGFFLSEKGLLAANDLSVSRKLFRAADLAKLIPASGQRHIAIQNGHVFVFTSGSKRFLEIAGYPEGDGNFANHEFRAEFPAMPRFRPGAILEIDGDNGLFATIITHEDSPASLINMNLDGQLRQNPF